MTTLIKLGGSLITDKTQPKSFRKTVLHQIIKQIKQIKANSTEVKLVIGHGSGSFGHVEAKKYDTIHGVNDAHQWLGYTKVACAASELSQLVWSEFVDNDLPVIRFQPTSSLEAHDGIVQKLDTQSIETALANHLIPLVHGDVAFDTKRGGTIISTESLFQYIIQKITVQQIILLGEVDGVFDTNGQVIPSITPQTLDDVQTALKGSSGTDVTGGMLQKVRDMLQIVQAHPNIRIIIANGKTPNILQDIMNHTKPVGTVISST